MSAHLHAPNQPMQGPHQPAVSLADWAEASALALMLFIAAVVVVTILALVFIV
jgi:hypothetical protein